MKPTYAASSVTTTERQRLRRFGSSAAGRLPAIDHAKGLAILGVLLIHARPLVGTPFGDHVVNRAVPIFLVLFGMTSELWWARRAPQMSTVALVAWFRSRVARLMVPLWGALAVWWFGVFAFALPVPGAPRFVVATVLGYLPWIGTGWFVTLILQLVVLFPLLHWCVRRFGPSRCLVGAALVTVASYLGMYGITAVMRRLLLETGPREGLEAFYYFWIFAPARLFPVVVGIVLARGSMPSRSMALAAASVVVGGWIIEWQVLDDPRADQALAALLDAPLTIALLGLLGMVPPRAVLGRGLAWCGVVSWGLYLGQMLVHDGAHALGLAPEQASVPLRWLYAAGLLTGAAALVVLGDGARRLLLRRTTTPKD